MFHFNSTQTKTGTECVRCIAQQNMHNIPITWKNILMLTNMYKQNLFNFPISFSPCSSHLLKVQYASRSKNSIK
uniref:Uncharacterized protein n=1 Tax=Anguilla anguilla TaxID=7936 RepID=A0A0E9WJI1_ANGAN